MMASMSVSLLERVGLFADLDAEALEEMGACLRSRRYARNQVIFAAGDPGTSLCIVAAGRVNMVVTSPDGKELIVNALGPGDFFGEMSLLDGEPRSTDAVASEPTQLMLLRREDFLRVLDARPSVARQLLAVLTRKLRQTTQQAQDVVFLDGPARLARTLLELAGVGERGADRPVALPRRVTQVELAGLIGATRESVNKAIAQYERQGLIQLDHGLITVLQPTALRRRAS